MDLYINSCQKFRFKVKTCGKSAAVSFQTDRSVSDHSHETAVMITLYSVSSKVMYLVL